MPNRSKRLSNGRLPALLQQGLSPSRFGLRLAVASAILVLLLQPGCMHKKSLTAVYPTSPIRIAFLPLSAPADNPDLRWIALGAPIMMAKTSERCQDLEVVPLWETMPVAMDAAGASRAITEETAAYIASRLTAKWATMGEISPTPCRLLSLLVDCDVRVFPVAL